MKKIFLITLLITIFLLSSVSASIWDGLVGYYSFDSGNVTIPDVRYRVNSITNFTGQAGIQNYTSKIRGASLEMNDVAYNTSQFFGYNIYQANNRTFCAWAYLNKTGQYIFSSGKGVNSDNFYASTTLYIGEGATDTTIPLQYNHWDYYCYVYDGANTNIRVWINGTNQNNITYNANHGDSNLVVGARGDGQGNFRGKLDEMSIWNRTLQPTEISYLYNDGLGISYYSDVNLISPANNSFLVSVPLFNFTILSPDVTNFTLYINQPNGTITTTFFNNNLLCDYSTHPTYCNPSYTPSSLGNIGIYTWGVSAGINNGSISSSVLNNTFTYGYIINSNTYNSTTYETSYESFTTNVSLQSGISVVTANLLYNGTSYSGTASASGSNYILSDTFDIPEGAGNKNWFWSLLYSDGFSQNLTTNNQLISGINFTLCGASPQNTSFINFTFKDESTLSSLTSVLVDSSSWTYYLGSGDVTKTYTYQNSSGMSSYAFCFTPMNRTLYTTTSFKYSKTDYSQRTYASDLTLTNSVTNTVLYLLSTADGISSSIQVVDTGLNVIEGVSVVMERYLSGVWTTIETGTTDSAGLVTFFVNPNYDYRFTASKTGYTSATVTIRPSQSTYTLKLSALGSGATYITSIEGIKWYYYPQVGAIPSGVTNFNATIFSDFGILENCKLDLLNAKNTSQILSTSTSITNSTYCQLSFNYNVGNEDRLFGRLWVDTINSTGFVILDSDAKWISLDANSSSFGTITSFFEDLNSLNEFGDTDSRAEFSKFVMFFLIFSIILGVFIFISGYELVSPGVSILIIWFIVLIATFGGFLTFELGSSNVSQNMGELGFLLMFSLFSVGYVLNTLRRYNE